MQSFNTYILPPFDYRVPSDYSMQITQLNDTINFVKGGRGLATVDITLTKRSSRDDILSAIEGCGAVILPYLTVDLQHDRAFLLDAIQRDANVLNGVDTTFKNDRSFILDAVQRNGNALEHASATFKNDRQVVLAAVRQARGALRYASIILQYDPVLLQCANLSYSFLIQTVAALAVSATAMTIGLLILTSVIAAPMLVGVALAVTGLAATGFFAAKVTQHQLQVNALSTHEDNEQEVTPTIVNAG